MPKLKDALDPKYKGSRAYTHKWQGIVPSQHGSEPEHTGYDVDKLKKIGRKTVAIPEGFNVHPRLLKMHISNRLKTLD